MSIEDRLAIREQIARYSYVWDELDAAGYADLFTDDAVFEVDPTLPEGPSVHLESRAAILEWARSRFEGRGRIRTRHNQSGTVFEQLSADSARTRTMNLTMRWLRGEARPELWSTGVYVDEWRKTTEGWRMARRTLHHDRM